MTALELTSPIIEALGWTLLHSVWQGALIMLILAGVLGLIPTKAAHLRYTTAVVGLFIMLAWAGFTFSQHYEASEQYDIWLSGNMEEMPVQESLLLGEPATIVVTESAGLLNNLFTDIGTWLQTYTDEIAWIWMLGVILFSLKWLGGLYVIYRYKRSATTLEDAAWNNRLSQLAHKLGIQRLIELRESVHITTPMVVGWLKPVILVPTGMLSGLHPDQIEAIFVHELAHIRRHDYLVNLLVSMGEIVFFYHPAYWWLSKSIRTEREHCCDDMAISVCSNPLSYAKALTELAQQQNTPAMAMAFSGNRHSLKFRIQRLFSKPTPNRSATVRAFIALFLLCGLWTFGMANRWDQDANFEGNLFDEEWITEEALEAEEIIEREMEVRQYYDQMRKAEKAEQLIEQIQSIRESKHNLDQQILKKFPNANLSRMFPDHESSLEDILAKAYVEIAEGLYAKVDTPPSRYRYRYNYRRSAPPAPPAPSTPPMPPLPEVLHDLPDMLNDILGDVYHNDYDELTSEQKRALRKAERSLERAFEDWGVRMEDWGHKFEGQMKDWEEGDMEEWAEAMEQWGEAFGEEWEARADAFKREYGDDWEKEMEKFGEEFGEEFGERFGEEFGEKYAKKWEKWGEKMEKWAEKNEGKHNGFHFEFDHDDHYDHDDDDRRRIYEELEHRREEMEHRREEMEHRREEMEHRREEMEERREEMRARREEGRRERNNRFYYNDNGQNSRQREYEEAEREIREMQEEVRAHQRDKQDHLRELQDQLRMAEEQRRMAEEQLRIAQRQMEQTERDQYRIRAENQRRKAEALRELEEMHRDERRRQIEGHSRVYRDDDYSTRFYFEGKGGNDKKLDKFTRIKRQMMEDGLLDPDNRQEISFRVKDNEIVWIKVDGERLSDRQVRRYQEMLEE